MKSLPYTLVVLLIITLSSCTEKPKKNYSMSQMEWLAGSWEGMANNAPFYEAWRKMNDSMMINFSIEIANGDTIVKENGLIRVSPDKGSYQSANVIWDLASLTDKEIVFVNDTINFANRFIWTKADNGHWLTDVQNPNGKIHYDLKPASWLEPHIDAYAHMGHSH